MSYHYYTEKYKEASRSLKSADIKQEHVVSWQSPSNIALVKYWGKHGNQLPDNATISLTLSKSVTQTKVTYTPAINKREPLEYIFNGQRNETFEHKIKGYLDHTMAFLPFLKDVNLKIESKNSFPHSAGIASSASSISALALCLVNMEQDLFGTLSNQNDFLNKASFLARLGSGSACRSVYGYSALWGYTPEVKGTSNEIAIPFEIGLHPVYKDFCNAILVVDSGPKEVSSSAGHKMMNNHFFREGRILQATKNFGDLLKMLKNGDLDYFIKVVESEALSLHALIISSNPGFILLKPNTLKIIQEIKFFRGQSGLPIAYTIDAGPNIHLLYPKNLKKQVTDFIENDLKPYLENGFWIDDAVSDGPLCLNDSL